MNLIMLKLKSMWHGVVYSVATALIIGVAGLQVSQNRTALAQSNNCGGSVSFVSPAQGEVLDGTVELSVYVSPTTGGTIGAVEEVEFEAGSTFLADANEEAPSIWSAQVDTRTAQNGDRQVRAKLFGPNSDLICVTAPVFVTIQNDSDNTANESRKFRLVRKTPLTSPWVGITNVSKVFRVEAQLVDSDGKAQPVGSGVDYNWTFDGSARGSLGSNTSGSAISYWTGSSPGETSLIVTAKFQDQTDQIRFNVAVESAATANYPENLKPKDTTFVAIDPDELDSSDTQTEGTDQVDEEIVRPTLEERVSSDPDLRDCLIDVIGEDNYDSVVSGDRRLTFKELRSAERCFASTRFVIPANVAPVEPSKVREIREDSDRARVASIEQASDNEEDRGFVMSGNATPNSTILIYVFSEPLVLTTTTDENGNWTYVLEDPLEPGEHEVFVAVEDDEGEVVRSSSFSFNVAQPASIGASPSGLSLTLDLSDPSQNSTIYYVSGVVAIMLIGLGLYIFTVRRQHVLEDVASEKVEQKQ